MHTACVVIGNEQRPHLAGEQEGGVLSALPDVERLVLQATVDVLQLQLQRPDSQRATQRAHLRHR